MKPCNCKRVCIFDINKVSKSIVLIFCAHNINEIYSKYTCNLFGLLFGILSLVFRIYLVY